MQSIINRIEKFGKLAPQEDIASKKRKKQKQIVPKENPTNSQQTQ
jgi:hypothetical protein